jgi:hypothetical protein
MRPAGRAGADDWKKRILPMARSLCSLRVAALLAASSVVGVLGSAPAGAQFFNPFEALFGPPPRPPSGVPGARPQAPQQGYPAYPDQRNDPRYQEQPYPGQANVPRRGPVQTEPLPPPPGGATASVDPYAPRPPRGGPQPLDTSLQPGDDVAAEPPSQKIENKGALFSGLDKITGRIINFDAAVGETVQFGALQVTPRICFTRPPTETPNTDAFIEVDEITLQGEVKRIFTGWVFASSPGLHAVEHPIYDVWLTDCKGPVVAVAVPEPAPVAAPTPPGAKPAASGQRRPSQQQQAQPQPPPQPPPQQSGFGQRWMPPPPPR